MVNVGSPTKHRVRHSVAEIKVKPCAEDGFDGTAGEKGLAGVRVTSCKLEVFVLVDHKENTYNTAAIHGQVFGFVRNYYWLF